MALVIHFINILYLYILILKFFNYERNIFDWNARNGRVGGNRFVRSSLLWSKENT
jgi:hypothetical protein